LVNAGSIAGLMLTTDCAINEIPKEETEAMPNPGMGMM
jgi:chaperonin GroEL (HSP60 family)